MDTTTLGLLLMGIAFILLSTGESPVWWSWVEFSAGVLSFTLGAARAFPR